MLGFAGKTLGVYAMEEPLESQPAPAQQESKRKKKDKPWEDDSVDHWKVEAYTQDDAKHTLQEESAFAVLFPQYREKYLREAWPQARGRHWRVWLWRLRPL